jgi:hypothetical protein
MHFLNSLIYLYPVLKTEFRYERKFSNHVPQLCALACKSAKQSRRGCKEPGLIVQGEDDCACVLLTHNSQAEDPEEEPVQHHGHVLPVLLHLHSVVLTGMDAGGVLDAVVGKINHFIFKALIF